MEKIKVKIGDKEVTGLLIRLPGEVNATTYVPIPGPIMMLWLSRLKRP